VATVRRCRVAGSPGAVSAVSAVPAHENVVNKLRAACRRAQEVFKARDRFCESQQPRIDSLWRFVQEQRVRRRQARPSLLCVWVGAHAL